MKTVTLDTNTVDNDSFTEAARARGWEVTYITVTDREIQGSGIMPASGAAAQIMEPFVLD